jgi:hypothetical protein
LKKLQIKQIQGSASLSLRKCKGKTYTAGDLKSESSVNWISSGIYAVQLCTSKDVRKIYLQWFASLEIRPGSVNSQPLKWDGFIWSKFLAVLLTIKTILTMKLRGNDLAEKVRIDTERSSNMCKKFWTYGAIIYQ